MNAIMTAEVQWWLFGTCVATKRGTSFLSPFALLWWRITVENHTSWKNYDESLEPRWWNERDRKRLTVNGSSNTSHPTLECRFSLVCWFINSKFHYKFQCARIASAFQVKFTVIYFVQTMIRHLDSFWNVNEPKQKRKKFFHQRQQPPARTRLMHQHSVARQNFSKTIYERDGHISFQEIITCPLARTICERQAMWPMAGSAVHSRLCSLPICSLASRTCNAQWTRTKHHRCGKRVLALENDAKRPKERKNERTKERSQRHTSTFDEE